MSLPKLIVIGILLVVVIAAFVLAVMQTLTKKQKISEDQKFQKYNKRFSFYYDFVLSRQLFRKVYEQVGNLSVYNLLECRMVCVKFYERALRTAVILFIIGFIGLGDIISGFVLIMFAYVMINDSVSKRIDGVNFQSLGAQSKYLQSVRECYTRIRNIPDAINEAECPPLLQRQVNEIYLICTANDARHRLEEFYKTCPNRIMRTLATTCYIRSDAGEDNKGYSPFKQAIGLIKDEVDMERRRQINQRILFSSLDKLPFVPLFLYPPIKMFYTKLISATAAVFDSGTGYVIKLVVLIACFVSYYVLSTLHNSSVARMDDRMESLKKLMYRDSVQRFAKTLVPKNFKVRMKLQKRMNGCLSQKTMEYFYLEKLVYGSVLFCLSIIFSIIILFSARNAVYNSLAASTMSVTLKYTEKQERLTREYDAAVLDMDQLPDDETIYNTFRKIFPKYTSLEVESQRDRLKDKYNTYHNLHFKWWLSLLYIGVATIGWFIPNLLLKLRVTMVRSESEMDVLQLQTIIAILMDTPLDTMSVIYWLAKSSDIHKDVLSYCYHEYTRDPAFALDHLKSKSASPEFSAMCDKLITTIHQVTLGEAFEDLIVERENTMKIREVVELNALKTKRNIAGPIATAPMVVWMGAVFILPIGIVAVKSALSMVDQLKTM